MADGVELEAGPVQQPQSNVLLDIETRTTQLLTTTLLDTLSACDEVLLAHAQQAINGMRQAQYFDDQRQLRNDRDIAASRFRAACRQAFRNMGQQSIATETRKRGGTELHLVADEDLELDLALLRIGKCCEDVASRVRHQVRRRLQVLLGLDENMTSPFCGAAIARMCRAAIAPIELGMESRLLVLKQLERNLANAMEPALDFANSALLARGVLPQLRAASAAPRAGAPSASPASVAASTAPASESAVPMSGADLNAVVAQVAQWLAQNGPVADAALEAAAAPALEPEAAAAPAATQAQELARERRRLEIAERRSAELTRARELRAAAESSADAVLGGVIGQAHVPESMCDLMRGPLRRHLETIHARRGETSPEWRSACKLVRDIGWALDPESAHSEQGHWREMLPAIGDSLRSALHSVRVVDHEVERVVRGFGERCEQLLSRNHPAEASAEIASLDEARDDVVHAAHDEPAAPSEAAVAAVTAAVVVPSFSEALRHVRQLTPGRWFELPDDQGLYQRAKLVWTSATTERCLFVNGQGKLVADRPYARVAHDFVAGAFREVDSAGKALP